MLQGHIDLICAPVHEAHKEYYELLTLYIKREYRLGSAEAKRLVRLANSKQKVAGKSMRMPVRAIIKKDNDLFGTLPSAEERLLNRTFTASERTLSRVDSQINQIITDGYRSGKGINDVANSLNQRFDQLTSWESKRIARTEIHNSHNTAVMDTYQELNVEYTMWITAHDERVRGLKKGDRANHFKLDGEIIPMGETYSNGLKYPGDTDGPLVEWINCRCSNAPYVLPYGKMPPQGMKQFRESDLIDIKDMPNEILPPQNYGDPLVPATGETHINQDNMGITQDGYNGIKKFADKRKNMKTEYGCIIDLKTGEVYSREFHGGKGEVRILEKETVRTGLSKNEIKKIQRDDPYGWLMGKYKDKLGTETVLNYVKSKYCAALHNHPIRGYSIFSPEDISMTIKSKTLDYCIAVSKHETWILKVHDKSDKLRLDKFVKDYTELTDNIRQKQKAWQDSEVERIKKIPNTKERIEEYRKLNEYLESEDYKRRLDKEMNAEVMNFVEKHNDVITFKMVKTDELGKALTEIVEPKNKTVKPKIETPKPRKINIEDTSKVLDDVLNDPLYKPKKQRVSTTKQKTETPSKRTNTVESNIKPKQKGTYTTEIRNGEKYTRWNDSKNMSTKDRMKRPHSSIENMEQYQDPVNYTEKELYSLYDYQGNKSADINKLMNDPKSREKWDENDKVLNKNIDEEIKSIKSAIDKSPGLPENTILYTGQSLPTNLRHIKNPKDLVGKKINFKHFVSASFDERVGKQFSNRDGRYLFEIEGKKGLEGVALTEKWRGKKVRRGAGEEEFILKPEMDFEIVDYIESENKFIIRR